MTRITDPLFAEFASIYEACRPLGPRDVDQLELWEIAAYMGETSEIVGLPDPEQGPTPRRHGGRRSGVSPLMRARLAAIKSGAPPPEPEPTPTALAMVLGSKLRGG